MKVIRPNNLTNHRFPRSLSLVVLLVARIYILSFMLLSDPMHPLLSLLLATPPPTWSHQTPPQPSQAVKDVRDVSLARATRSSPSWSAIPPPLDAPLSKPPQSGLLAPHHPTFSNIFPILPSFLTFLASNPANFYDLCSIFVRGSMDSDVNLTLGSDFQPSTTYILPPSLPPFRDKIISSSSSYHQTTKSNSNFLPTIFYLRSWSRFCYQSWAISILWVTTSSDHHITFQSSKPSIPGYFMVQLDGMELQSLLYSLSTSPR